MDIPTIKPVIKHKLYCWMDSTRQCGSDCVVFDLKGAEDTSGKYTMCKLCNHLDGLCRSNVTIARFLETVTKKNIPGVNIPPPSVGI